MNESLFFFSKKNQSKQSEVNQVAFVWSSYGSDNLSAYTVLAYFIICRVIANFLNMFFGCVVIYKHLLSNLFMLNLSHNVYATYLSLFQSRLSRIFQKFRLTISLRFARGFAKQLTTKSVCVLNIDSSKMGCVLNISSF